MNSKYESPERAAEALRERIEQCKTTLQTVAARIMLGRSYVEGVQWMGSSFGSVYDPSTGRTRPMQTNWNPGSPIVATINRIAKLIQESTAAAYVASMEVECVPGDRATGIEASHAAQTLEALCNWLIRWTDYVPAARAVNYQRCVDGVAVLGWGIKAQERMHKLRGGGEESVVDQVLTCGRFNGFDFLLDPACQELDLHQHEEVVWSNVWTVDKLRREWKVEINPDDCPTMGELMAMELHYNSLSQNRLYTQLPLFSKTKAVRVYQIHSKGPDGNFPTMLMGYDSPKKKEITFVNFDNQETPFGGNGLPFTMFHGHRRPDSMWSLSDVAMLKDDQDRLNLVGTLFKRMLRNNAGLQWLVSRGAIDGKDVDNFKDQFNNAVGGVILYEGGSKDRPVQEPRLIQYQQPPQGLQDIIHGYEQDMRGQVHRPDITAGAYKTHTTKDTFARAQEAAGQVLGNRQSEDLGRHEAHLAVGLGTVIRLVRAGNPSVLACLHRAGFDETDYVAINSEDPRYFSCKIGILESSVKYQSPEQKEQRLWNAIGAQAITPVKLRQALASMDVAVDEDDKAMYENARRAATRVLHGEEWHGEFYGEYNDTYIVAFQRALDDPKARRDPETLERVRRAVETQKKYQLAEMQMDAMAQAPQQPAPEQAAPMAEEAAPEGPDEADLTSLLSAIQAGSTAQAA